MMASEKELYSMELPGYWMDIGQPKDYLTGMCLHLESLSTRESTALATGDDFVGNVLIVRFNYRSIYTEWNRTRVPRLEKDA